MTKRKPLFIFARAAMTLLVMLLTTATAWAERVNYKDATGNMVSVEATVLTNSTDVSNLATGWYVVKGNVSYTSCVTFNGNVNLILADDAELTVGDYDECSIFVEGSLTIYSQSSGSNQGAITIVPGVYDSGSSYADDGIYAEGDINIYGGKIISTGIYHGIKTKGDINVYGGTVIATGNYGISAAEGNITISDGSVSAIGQYYSGIYANYITIKDGEINATGSEDGISAYNDIIINGGSINATGYFGIYTSGNITITNGSISAIGQGECGISADYVTIEDGEINATGSEDGIHAYNDISINGGSVTINSQENGEYPEAGIFAYGVITINGGTVISNGSDFGIGSGNGTIILAGATVKASRYSGTINYKLTANLADGNYWSTFYFGSLGFTINEGVDACAYTATYGLNSETNKYELTLHNLGKDIPQGTAVIIVSSTASVNMTSNSNLGTFSGSNDLRGVDVATSLESLKGTYSADALLMLSNKNNHFGFHEVALTNVPARKAFLPIKDSTGARSLNIVFEDGNTTGINAVNREERIVNSEDAWFDLQGRKIQMPTQRGLYIHNGKKIVVK